MSRTLLLALALLSAAPLTACSPEPAASPHQRYHCPMHPSFTADSPGSCPICGMFLVPIEPAADTADPVSGRAAVPVTDDGRRLAGIAVERAAIRLIAPTHRLAGTVRADDARTTRVQTRAAGWVETVSVRTEGVAVQRGDVLLRIFSPDVLAGEAELRLALASGHSALAAAARERLAIFDIPATRLAAIEAGAPVSRTVELIAPQSGFVTAKASWAGVRVEPGVDLFEITDLATVFIDVAMPVSLTVRPGISARWIGPDGVAHDATALLVAPRIDDPSRTGTLRLAVDNAGAQLRPGQWVEVGVDGEATETLAVPSSAVLDTGARTLAYVETTSGRFEPREVQTGLRAGGFVAIEAGLQAGELVATHGTFLLDADARIRAAAR